MKRLLIVICATALVLAIAGAIWARAVFGGDGVRTAIEAQLSKAIGQPVSIGSISASALPRVTVHLRDVRVGGENAIQLGDLQIGTDFRALLSRRIEHATLRLKGADITLPLPPLTGLTAPSNETTGPSPVQLVSVDEVVLSDLKITSGGRTIAGDIELVPHGNAVTIRKIQLGAGSANIAASGEITSLAGPVGTIKLTAAALDINELLAFAQAFASGSGFGAPERGGTSGTARGSGRTAPPSALDLTLTLDASRATMGELVVTALQGSARITSDAVALAPIDFNLFGGRYQGSVTMSLDSVPVIRARATLSGLDVAAATAFAGSPDTISGRLSGRLDVQARGSTPSALINSASGSLRADITDGIVSNLGLVHAVVNATSMRSGAAQNAAGGSRDEPFSRVGATFVLGNAVARTDDLRFESKDLDMTAQGALDLRASTMNFKARMQLSDELSAQAGRDLVRYTQEGGRVTLPATITGPFGAPSVGIDVGDLAKRAITNAASDELKKRMQGLSDVFKK
jgi:uncharacterized protein involved in outer membrane biogenesis